jgi:hypothetical protein
MSVKPEVWRYESRLRKEVGPPKRVIRLGIAWGTKLVFC